MLHCKAMRAMPLRYRGGNRGRYVPRNAQGNPGPEIWIYQRPGDPGLRTETWGTRTPAEAKGPLMPDIRRNTAMRVVMAAIAAIAWFALGLQLYLEILRSLAGAGPMLTIVARYFSFFTILTNLLVAVALTLSLVLPRSSLGQFFSRAAVKAGIAVYIAVVGAIYSVLLRHLWSPVGAQKLADILLHDVVPVTYVLYWLIFVPKAQLRWKHALLWLVYPIAYMAYTLIHGALSAWYPYPFIDAAALGFSRALANGALVLLVFLALGLAAVALGHWIGRWSGRGPARYQ